MGGETLASKWRHGLEFFHTMPPTLAAISSRT
ncbi:hypothetical protein RSAG8_12538, partial [Rhizoctonia solani AG-8 WAC10335]